MRHLIPSCLFLIFSVSVSAQGKFYSGNIVLNSNDTLSGEIEYNDWTVNPETIRFRRSNNSQTYKVSDLKAFSIAGKADYRRFAVSYQLSADNLQNATETFNAPEVKKEHWLKSLYRGKYSLYQLETDKRTFFFVEAENREIQELIYRVRVINGDLQKDEQYKNLLNRYAIEANKSDVLQRKIEAIEYNDDDLVKIFNLLSVGSSSYSTESRRPRFDIRGGIAFSSFTASGSVYNDGSGAYSLYAADFKSSVGFVGGVGVTFYSRNNGHVQPRLGLNIATLSLDGENNKGGAFQREKYSGTMIVMGPEISLQWLINNGKQTTLTLGPFLSYNLVVSSNFKGTFENPGVTIVKDKFPAADGGHFNAGARFSVTGLWGILSLQGHYCTNLFNSVQTALKSTVIGITYGYIFGK